jgi:P27 family predicted phage terminase small subunit
MPPGRRPTPTSTKILNGNPGHRGINRNEPKFTGTPTCPKHLDKDAKTEWKRIAPVLTSSGLLTSADRAALSAYCAAWSRWLNAELSIQKFGAVIKSPKSGFPIQNPYVGVANTALTQMRAFLIEFGMTPAARSRIQVEPNGGGGGDPFANFMRGIGAIDRDEETHDEIESEQLCDTSN